MQPTRILVFGTFDFLHKGHLDFFKQARRLAKNPHLIVSVARASNVKKIKGKPPVLKTQDRVGAVSKAPGVNEVVLGAANDYLGHIAKLRPRIIALGYDQTSYTKGLRKKLRERGLTVKIVRLKPHKPHVYKSSLVKRKMGKI